MLAFPQVQPVIGVIINESARPALQSASSPNGSFVVLDGEVYQVPDLLEANCPDLSDAGKILALYTARGEEGLADVDAAASITIWDAPRGLLLVFRDRWGIVPAFYTERPDGLFWASHIETLLRVDHRGQINLAAFDFFFGNGFIPAPWTLVDGISRIPPAHVLSARPAAAIRLDRYWRPTARPRLKLSMAETAERLGALFVKSLSRRCLPDQKCGVLLSGGVDSKLLLAALCKRLRVRPEAFTFDYSDYIGRFNEGNEARRAANYFGVPHHEMTFRPADIVDNLEWMLRSYGEPFTYGLHTSMLRDVVNAGAGVVLSGAGAGYLYPRRKEIAGRYLARLPGALRMLGPCSVALLRWLNERSRPHCLWRSYEAAGDLADQAEATIWCSRTGLPANFGGMILPDQFRTSYYEDSSWVASCRRAADELFASAPQDFAEESDLDRITFLDFQYRAAEGTLYWNHWWARAHGLTVRFPYFDAELLDFALRLPRRSTDKKDLRRLAATLMPRDMAYAPTASQTIPIGHWFRGPLREFLRDQLAPERLRASGLFNGRMVDRLIREHLRGAVGHEWKLWAILTVVVWQDVVLRSGPNRLRSIALTGVQGRDDTVELWA